MIKCELDHESLKQELITKGFTFGKCPDCDEVILVTVKPRSEERQLWIDKYGDKNDI